MYECVRFAASLLLLMYINTTDLQNMSCQYMSKLALLLDASTCLNAEALCHPRLNKSFSKDRGCVHK